MTTAELIRTSRVEAGLTQDDVASRLHVSQPLISRWEQNRQTPSISQCVELERLFGMRPGTLLIHAGYDDQAGN